MPKSSFKDKGPVLTKESIIGMGEESFRKNHFPTLQKKIGDLELLNGKYRTLIETIPDILLVSNDGKLALFSSLSQTAAALAHAMLDSEEITGLITEAVEEARRDRRLVTVNFTFAFKAFLGHYEARANVTQMDDVLVIVRDMTTEVLFQEKLRDMAMRDGLTRLYSRRYFEERLAEIDGRYMENQAIIVMDIDGLKIINDTMGHEAGDKLIITVAGILTNIFDEAMCIARIGGDEFGVLITGLHQDAIERQLENFGSEIKKYKRKKDTLNLSVSYGYSFIKKAVADLSMMFREADNKMYQNKLLKENSNRSSIVKALTKMLEAKDFITQGHAQRMERLAVMMGRTLGLSHNQIDRLELLAKFHDIGKVGIPDSILMKPGRLTENEWEIMKSHSIIGKRIAETSPELREISQLILLHHERWDATGYPLGMRGEDIPVECRILSIIDTFDAMTNDRPYRNALSLKEAGAEIARCAGTQFDEHLVHIFFTIIDCNGKLAL